MCESKSAILRNLLLVSIVDVLYVRNKRARGSRALVLFRVLENLKEER